MVLGFLVAEARTFSCSSFVSPLSRCSTNEKNFGMVRFTTYVSPINLFIHRWYVSPTIFFFSFCRR